MKNPPLSALLRHSIYRPDFEQIRNVVTLVFLLAFGTIVFAAARDPKVATVADLLAVAAMAGLIVGTVVAVEGFLILQWQRFLYARACASLATFDAEDPTAYVRGELRPATFEARLVRRMNGRMYRTVTLADGTQFRAHFDERLDETLIVRFYRRPASLLQPFGLHFVIPEDRFGARRAESAGDESVDRRAA